MHPMFRTLLAPALRLLLVMTLLLGFLYPLAITAIAELAFPHAAHGSLLYRDGRLAGSSLIGQNFTDPGHFWGRPSATTPQPYNGLASSGSNLGPLNPALIDAVKANVAALRAADPGNTAAIPVDLVTASASGLDPEISPAGARFQAARVARARHLPLQSVLGLIDAHIAGRWLGLVGEPRVNVLELNFALDEVAARDPIH